MLVDKHLCDVILQRGVVLVVRPYQRKAHERAIAGIDAEKSDVLFPASTVLVLPMMRKMEILCAWNARLIAFLLTISMAALDTSDWVKLRLTPRKLPPFMSGEMLLVESWVGASSVVVMAVEMIFWYSDDLDYRARNVTLGEELIRGRGGLCMPGHESDPLLDPENTCSKRSSEVYEAEGRAKHVTKILQRCDVVYGVGKNVGDDFGEFGAYDSEANMMAVLSEFM